jgi:hypothetical protein
MGLIFQPLYGQESYLKEYAIGNIKRTYCFYPSTLRMLNLSQNQEYNEMIQDIDKILVYNLDSAAIASASYLKVIERYKEAGFEEYASIWGSTNFFLYGSDDSEEMVGVFGQDDTAMAFYLKGTIGLQKIPTLMNTFQSSEFLNIMDLQINPIDD